MLLLQIVTTTSSFIMEVDKMKNWILIIDSLNSILTDSIANKEIAYTCNDASKITYGDRLLGYISTPIGEIRMLLTATRNGNETTMFVEKLFEVSSGCKVSEDLYSQILAVSSTENKCVEISEDNYNELVWKMFESIDAQKQALFDDTSVVNNDWYSVSATEQEYNTFKKLLRYFVKQLNINNGLISGEKTFVNSGTPKATELIKEWNKYNGFELSCRFARGYQLTQDNAHYLNYVWVNLNPHFDKNTKSCVSLNINVKPDMNVLYKGENYSVEDLDLESDVSANESVRKMFDELREQIYKWQQGVYNNESVEINADDQEASFAIWLNGLKKADGSRLYAETYCYKIVKIANKVDELFDFPPFEHIYEITDINEYAAAVDVIKSHPDYKEINKGNSNGTISAMLSLYGRFLQFSEMTQEKIKFETTYVNRRYTMNRIVFGAPGTGKSHTLNKDVQNLVTNDNATFERVTFHPEYTYSSFVGCYKPVSESSGIEYKYVAGPFMRVLVEAYKSGRTENPRPHILLIEELNRARVAAVFGEVFQLLDRDTSGQSEYEIAPSEDVKKYLLSELGGEISDYEKIRIPNNMFIWATMNSADQGVFPMDTAFKRRWNFEYIGIDDNDVKVKSIIKIKGHVYDWNRLRKAINAKMSVLKINEDKLLGPYFIAKQYFNTDENNSTANDDFISVFKNKVLMYLFEDACKQKSKDMFEGCDHSRYSRICAAFDEKGIEIFGKTFKTEYYDKEN